MHARAGSWTAGTGPRRSLRARSLRLTLIALAGLGVVFVVWRALPEGRMALAHVRLARLPLYIGLVFAIVGLQAFRWRLVLERIGARLPLPRLMQLWLAGRAVGSLIPSGTLAGEPVRTYLLRASGVPLATAAGGVALDRTLELVGNMIAAPVSIGAALALGAGSLAGVLVATLVGLAGLGVCGFVYVRASQAAPALTTLLGPVPLQRGRLGHALATLQWYAFDADLALQRLISQHPSLVPAGLALSLTIECLQLGEIALLYSVFGLAVPLPLLLLSSVGIGVARVVPVSASLGSLEAAQIGIFTLSGRSLALGVSVALVLRLAETFRIVVGLLCLATAPGGSGDLSRADP